MRASRQAQAWLSPSATLATQLRWQETANSVGGLAVNVPDTSSSSYGPATDEVRRDRSCSSRTCYIDLYQRSSQDLDTRTSYERPRKLSDKRQRRGSSRS